MGYHHYTLLADTTEETIRAKKEKRHNSKDRKESEHVGGLFNFESSVDRQWTF